MERASTHMNESSLRSRRLENAARLLPGGVRTMLHLAWLSSDSRVRSVASEWHSFSAVARVEAHIEDLCRSAGISDAEFAGEVTRTAWELGIDVAAFMLERLGHAVSLRSALGESLMTGQRVEVWLSPTEWNRRRDRLIALSDRQARGNAAALRQRLRLSQLQFAGLFITTARTVRRWEGGHCDLTWHQQWFLTLFKRYLKRSGVHAFRRRFVLDAPR